MPAITSLAIAAGAPVGRAVRTVGGRVVRGLKQLADRLRHRREAVRLASLDDRMLADIGLTRSDLRDAYAEPLWHDPTDVLAHRAAERRPSRRRTAFELSAACLAPPLSGAPRAFSCPPANRPAQYLM
jgi:uncharacterized protein YjiS (DUF1127 family)